MLCFLIQPPSVLPYTSGVVTWTYFWRNGFWQCIVQSHLGDHVGAVPMSGVEPTSATMPWAAKFTNSSG